MSEIMHDAGAGRFFAAAGAEEAVLRYVLQDNILDIKSVFVPPSFRGQGMAVKLVEAAFEFARSGNYRVIPTCPYVSGPFLKRYPAFLAQLCDPEQPLDPGARA